MKIVFRLALLALLMALFSCQKNSPRQVDDFNFGWLFSLGDSKEYSQPGFDDSNWRELHLPHDWSIEGEFDESNPSTFSGGALPGGIGWYRKHFNIEKTENRRYSVEFDGIFMNSEVYVNGILLGKRPYGYSSFSYEITTAIKPGDNVIAVKCDNAQQPNSRWYAGCGIYRDVRLVRTGNRYVGYNGVFVWTEGGIVHASARVEGDAGKVVFKVKSPSGTGCGSCEGTGSGNGLWEADVRVDKPEIWDIDSPALYTLTVEIFSEDGRLSDRYEQRFGFRTVEWSAEEGFFLNGRPLKLQGVCLHHDLGCIGSAFYPRAMEKRLLDLKKMGCNAVRTSHNPPAPAFLDMCDRLGLLVVDEALDMWRIPKTQYDYSRFFEEWHETDICDMVRRDRNHPCVILWSAGNELREQHVRDNQDSVIELSKHLAGLFRQMDPTRKVCVGLDWPDTSNVLIKSKAFDVLGLNYRPQYYDDLKAMLPDTPMVATEIASALQSRGWYPQPSDVELKMAALEEAEIHQCPAYDNCCAIWADTHAPAWNAVKSSRHIAGGFVWTGYDYLGEPTPYGWPSRSSYFGIFDLAGFPKDIYYMYESEWTRNDVLHLFPHWNWKQGDTVDLWCYYSNADEVELLLNGKSLGRSSKQGDRLHAQWLRVPFEEGEIRAISYKDGKKQMECSRQTSGPAATLCLTADRDRIKADGYDLCYVTVTALDAHGREVPTACDLLHFSVSGEGELFGVDNGDATDSLSLKGSEKALFAGKAVAVIRSLKGLKGKAVLTVSSEYDTKQLTVICGK